MNCGIVFRGQISSSKLILITSLPFPRSPHDKLTPHYLLSMFPLGGPVRKGETLHTRVLHTHTHRESKTLTPTWDLKRLLNWSSLSCIWMIVTHVQCYT